MVILSVMVDKILLGMGVGAAILTAAGFILFNDTNRSPRPKNPEYTLLNHIIEQGVPSETRQERGYVVNVYRGSMPDGKPLYLLHYHHLENRKTAICSLVRGGRTSSFLDGQDNQDIGCDGKVDWANVESGTRPYPVTELTEQEQNVVSDAFLTGLDNLQKTVPQRKSFHRIFNSHKYDVKGNLKIRYS